MSDYPSLLPYLVAFVALGVVAAAVALAVLVWLVAESRRTPAPGVVIVPAARTEAAGAPAATPAASIDGHHVQA